MGNIEPSEQESKSASDLDDTKDTLERDSKLDSAEILDDLPPEVKRVVEMGFSMQRISGGMQNPIMQKINERHIDRILDIAEKEETNSYADAQVSKKYGAFYFLAILLFIVFLIVFLIDRDKGLLLSIIEKSAYILGGFGGGYGLKAYLDNKKKG